MNDDGPPTDCLHRLNRDLPRLCLLRQFVCIGVVEPFFDGLGCNERPVGKSGIVSERELEVLILGSALTGSFQITPRRGEAGAKGPVLLLVQDRFISENLTNAIVPRRCPVTRTETGRDVACSDG